MTTHNPKHPMQTLYKPSQYPAPLLAKIKLLSPLAIEIANRWALGWPQGVKDLVQASQYLEALTRQEQEERDVLTRPGNSHLARHEIVQEFGLSLSPPEATPTL